MQRFSFPLDGQSGEIVNSVVSTAKPVWLQDPVPVSLRAEPVDRCHRAQRGVSCADRGNGSGHRGFSTRIGLFGDRQDDETWQGFLHFVQQASLSFEHVANRGRVRQ